jgi:hypothetical protein
LVDRRFNRARYETAATVAAFRHRLREAVDTETVQRELREAVVSAVAPTRVTVCVRQ